MRRKKILFISPSLSSGGSERVISILANNLSYKYDVELCLVRDKVDCYEVDDKVNLIRFKCKTSNKIIKIIKRLFFIRKEIKRNDIVISFMYDINFMTLIAGIGIKNKKIISERGNPIIENKKSFLIPLFRKLLYPLSDVIVFQTDQAMNWFSDKLKKKGVVIPNPINSTLYDYFSRKRRKVIVAVGRLTEQKNFPLLINAFEKISKKYPDFMLEIYGDGHLKSELASIVTKLNLSNRVIFKGYVNNIEEQIYDAYMYVSSSNYEGISNSMLEAMAMGIPSICTDCPVGGAKLVIKNNVNGILIPVGDEKALINAMDKLISDFDFARGISMKALELRKDYSIDKIVNMWVDIL